MHRMYSPKECDVQKLALLKPFVKNTWPPSASLLIHSEMLKMSFSRVSLYMTPCNSQGKAPIQVVINWLHNQDCVPETEAAANVDEVVRAAGGDSRRASVLRLDAELSPGTIHVFLFSFDTVGIGSNSINKYSIEVVTYFERKRSRLCSTYQRITADTRSKLVCYYKTWPHLSVLHDWEDISGTWLASWHQIRTI